MRSHCGFGQYGFPLQSSLFRDRFAGGALLCRRHGHRGFTLVEALVALAIFSLIGIAAWQVLDSVIRSDERTAQHHTMLRQYNRAMAQLRQDLEQVVPRSVRTAAGSERPWLLVSPTAPLALALTRAGTGNPLGLPRSAMQRVAYAVGPHPEQDDSDSPHYREQRRSYLLRYSWPHLDGMEREDARVQVVLDDIEEMTVAVVSERGRHPEWPATSPQQPPADGEPDPQPRLVDIELTHSRWGVLRHRVALL